MPDRTADLEHRLRLAHTARRAKEHQLDGIRRALCDAGFMQDDDPYGHADLADVIRQAGAVGTEKTGGRDICADRAPGFGLVDSDPEHPDFCILPQGHRSPWHQGEKGGKWRPVEPEPTAGVCAHAGPDGDAPSNPCTLPLGHDMHRDGDGCSWPAVGGPVLDRAAIRTVILFVASATGHPRPEFVDALTDQLWANTGRAAPTPAGPPCSINHNCPGQVRAEALTARNEPRCQSQHRPEGEPLVQCVRAVHVDDTHTDYDSTMDPPSGRDPELPWLTWRAIAEEADGSMLAPVADGRSVAILYVNHGGQRGYRQILPQRLWFGTTEWHTELQWFLDATDLDRGVLRSFALRGVLGFDLRPGPLA